jgi:hypothetical protein
MNPASNRRRFAGLLASLFFLLSVGQAAEGPAAGTVELPRCFGSHMVIPETKDEDAWFLWGWRAKAGGDVEIRFPGLATKPLGPDVRYYSYTNHPGWQLWHLDWGKLPAAVTQSGGRPFSIAITARAGKSTREILLTNVVLGQLVAVGVPPGPLAAPAARPLGSGIRLLRAGSLAWENLSPREAGAVFAQSWFPGSDLGPDAPERNAGVLYLLAELERARSALPDEAKPNLDFFQPGPEVVVGPATAAVALKSLGGGGGSLRPEPPATGSVSLPDTYARAKRQYLQLLEDTQHLMRESEYVRRDLWKQRADFSGAAQFTNSTQLLRQQFRDDVVGLIPAASLPPNVRTRLRFETNGVRGYDVVLDVHPDVFAYGILCVPTNLKPGERRAVVVCQHGLEGRPSDVSDPAVNSHFYHQYGLKLAEQGYVTFAPQNPYIGQTTFRQVLRKAQPLGLTLWSFIHRQHEVITDWLAAQDFVDPARIAFYGLSYGGKSAMRVPILVPRYCLSICSADYNEWIWKNVSARSPYGYLWTSEYDMPEWNLANQFNYAELSWLIFPRPFMVERGHDDGVAPDEWVAYEYAKTRRHYVKLGLADRTEIEFFDGPHSINGKGTFEFLRKHLPEPPK